MPTSTHWAGELATAPGPQWGGVDSNGEAEEEGLASASWLKGQQVPFLPGAVIPSWPLSEKARPRYEYRLCESSLSNMKEKKDLFFQLTKGNGLLLKILLGGVCHMSNFPSAYFSREAAPGLPYLITLLGAWLSSNCHSTYGSHLEDQWAVPNRERDLAHSKLCWNPGYSSYHVTLGQSLISWNGDNKL